MYTISNFSGILRFTLLLSVFIVELKWLWLPSLYGGKKWVIVMLFVIVFAN